jgi:hypothetical protein
MQLGHRRVETPLLLGLGLGPAVDFGGGERDALGHRQGDAVPPHVVLAVVEIAKEAPLAQIEVEGADCMAPRVRAATRCIAGGLARAALSRCPSR